ncbi:MAG: VOC family protein [Bacteroidia bacterium]|nr:VOC family protein [Bacteroidia bacterium]
MKNVKAIPEGFHSLAVYLTVNGADKAIDFYKNAFNAKEIGRLNSPDGKIGHAELQIGNSRFMLAEEMPEWGNKSPKTLGGSPASLCIYTEDVDKLFKQALEAGAKIDKGMDVKDQFYGDRSGSLLDPFGHSWIVATHIEDVSYEEMQKRYDGMMAEQQKK